MKSFLGKLVKYSLWLCLFVLLGTFFFGLFQFKGNFVQYITYLNSIDISQLFSSGTLSQDTSLSTGGVDQISGGVISGEFEGEFLPEPGTLDESDFGFSGTVGNSGQDSVKSQTGTVHSGSVSAETLVDLVKSKEK